MNQPLISIIVPVYNTAEYIEECILSILSQTYKNIELIIVNDGSTDTSGEICKRYDHLSNVSYIEQVKSGTVIARARGVEEAHGQWIMFVDSDDVLSDDAVQQLLAISSNASIVLGRLIGDTTLSNAPNQLSWDVYLYGLFDTTILGSPCAKLFRKNLFCDNPIAFEFKLARAEDVMMNLALARTNREVVPVCKKPIYHYRRRSSSSSFTNTFNFDVCNDLAVLAESLVDGVLPIERIKTGGLKRRLYFFYKVLEENDFHSNKNHPFVKDIIQRMNEAKILRLSDRLVLSVSSKPAVKTCLFLAKFLRRIEQPSLIIKDTRRLFKR